MILSEKLTFLRGIAWLAGFYAAETHTVVQLWPANEHSCKPKGSILRRRREGTREAPYSFCRGTPISGFQVNEFEGRIFECLADGVLLQQS